MPIQQRRTALATRQPIIWNHSASLEMSDNCRFEEMERFIYLFQKIPFRNVGTTWITRVTNELVNICKLEPEFTFRALVNMFKKTDFQLEPQFPITTAHVGKLEGLLESSRCHTVPFQCLHLT